MKIAVNLYMHTQVWRGYTEIPHEKRLLDYLNNQAAKLLEGGDRFIQLTDVSTSYENGIKEKVPTSFINKSAILLVTTTDRDSARGIGAKVGAKSYPFTLKSTLQVKLLIPNYVLLGSMHCFGVQTPHHILESNLMFLPLTDVKMRASEDEAWWEIPFVAVNREQILSVN